MKKFFTLILIFAGLQSYSFALDHVNGDTLTMKGYVVKPDMSKQAGEKLEGVQDYYFYSNGTSYFIKTASGNFKKEDLEKIVLKEVTIKYFKKFGNMDLAPGEDPSWKGNRTGEYILILEIIQ